MDIKTLLNNLHEEVSCSVCMSTFTEPKQLPCLHSFCLHCLSEILRTSGRHDIITCPECRKEVEVPRSGNLKDLPTNFRINSLLDVLAIKECNTTTVKCGNCDKKTSQSFYCFQCHAFWCEANCISLHNGMKANKEHRMLALKDFQDEDYENVLKRPSFCQKKHHEKEELKLFCKVCEVAICSACALTDHEGHAKILLEEAANERKIRLEAVIDSHKEKAQQERDKINNLDENVTEIEAQAAAAKRHVQMFAEKMIGAIEADKQEIFDEIDNQLKGLRERFAVQKNNVEHRERTRKTAVENAEILIKRSTSAEIVQFDESLNTIFQGEVADEGEQTDGDLEGIRRRVFRENETLMDKINTEGIGSFETFLTKTKACQSSADGKGISEAIVGLEAKFALTTRNSEGMQCYEVRDYVKVEIRNFQGHDCVTNVRIQDNRDGSYKISYFVKETGKCKASVTINGEHVRGSPFTVEVQPRQFRPVRSLGKQEKFEGPWGVAVNERDEIAVTDIDRHRVQVFSINGDYLRSFGIKGDKQGEFDAPTGIAFDNGNMIVTDTNNHRVQLFSEQGVYLSQFGGKGQLYHQLFNPHTLFVDSDGKIIVTDRDNQLIKIFSLSGQFLQKVGEGAILTKPISCVQHGKYLIVTGTDQHCVKVFHRNGRFLYRFGKKGNGDGELDTPRCLAVDKAGHLLVCDRNNHRIQLFERSGKFLAKFGKKGSKLGEFNGPIAAAVLSDGKIVVTDIDNHRVQIFE